MWCWCGVIWTFDIWSDDICDVMNFDLTMRCAVRCCNVTMWWCVGTLVLCWQWFIAIPQKFCLHWGLSVEVINLRQLSARRVNLWHSVVCRGETLKNVIKIIQTIWGTPSFCKLKTYLEAKRYQWHVIDVEAGDWVLYLSKCCRIILTSHMIPFAFTFL